METCTYIGKDEKGNPVVLVHQRQGQGEHHKILSRETAVSLLAGLEAGMIFAAEYIGKELVRVDKPKKVSATIPAPAPETALDTTLGS